MPRKKVDLVDVAATAMDPMMKRYFALFKAGKLRATLIVENEHEFITVGSHCFECTMEMLEDALEHAQEERNERRPEEVPPPGTTVN